MMSEPFAVQYYAAMGLVALWHTVEGVTQFVPVRVVVEDACAGTGCAGMNSLNQAKRQQQTYFGPQAESPNTVYRVAPLISSAERNCYRATALGRHATVHLDFEEDHGVLQTSLTLGNSLGPQATPLTVTMAELRFEDLYPGANAQYIASPRAARGVCQSGQIARLSREGVPLMQHAATTSEQNVYLIDALGRYGFRCRCRLSDNPVGWVQQGSGPDKAHWAIRWTLHRVLQPGQRYQFGGTASLSRLSDAPIPFDELTRLGESPAKYTLRPSPAT